MSIVPSPCMNGYSICLSMLLTFAMASNPARADLVITMTGTIAEGALNGGSLDGQGFTLTANLVDGVDLTAGDVNQGWFAASLIEMRFTSGSQFSFDVSNPTYFAQSVLDNWSVRAGLNVGILDLQASSVLGYNRADLTSYDPNSVSAPFFYSDFTESFAWRNFVPGGPPPEPAMFTSGGDSLVVNSRSVAIFPLDSSLSSATKTLQTCNREDFGPPCLLHADESI